MAGDKKEEEQQQEHIPTTNESKEEDEGKQGSGGLLSAVGDPAGKSLSSIFTSCTSSYSHNTPA